MKLRPSRESLFRVAILPSRWGCIRCSSWLLRSGGARRFLTTWSWLEGRGCTGEVIAPWLLGFVWRPGAVLTFRTFVAVTLLPDWGALVAVVVTVTTVLARLTALVRGVAARITRLLTTQLLLQLTKLL